MSKKVNLSFVDRAKAVDLLPTTGNVAKVEKTLGWIHELEMTKEEKEIEQSFNQIRDKTEQSKAIDDWLRTNKEIEISDELYEYLKTELNNINEANAIAVTDSLNIFHEFLGI